MLGGCSADSKKKLIGVVQYGNDERCRRLSQDMMMMGEASDSVRVSIKTADGSAAMQSRQIDSLVDMGASVLVVNPTKLDSIRPSVDRAYRKGIPVVLYGKRVDSDRFAAFAGADNYRIGKEAGIYMAKQLGGKGSIAEIQGPSGSSSAEDRHRGLLDALKEYPGVKISACERGDWGQTDGNKAMDRMLQKKIHFDYVFAHNDRMAYGAYLSANRHGLDMDRLKFVGVDGLSGPIDGIGLVRRGILDASFLNPTRGYAVVELASDIAYGNYYKRDNMFAPVLITDNNMALARLTLQTMDKRAEILRKLHDQMEQTEEYSAVKDVLILLLALFFVASIIAFVFAYRGYRIKNTLSQKLTKKNSDLRHLNDEVVELTQSRLAFFTNVSHELRTPLSLIVDPVEQLFASPNIDARERSLLKVIHRNTIALRQLVDDIMDFRKVQVGKMKLNLTRFDLKQRLALWVENFYPLTERRNINLNLDMEAFTRTGVVADEDKLNRVVFNLLGNAVKYTKGGGRIDITLADAPQGCFRLSVKDTGDGLSAEDKQKVFEKFYQAQNSTGGTGIGLAMVRAYAELHGGTVTVESELGKGSEFVIVMPCSQGTSGDSSSYAASTGDGRVIPTTLAGTDTEEDRNAVAKVIGESNNPTLLVVDDNQDIRDYICGTLGDSYEIIEAGNGKVGLEMALRYVPDIVLCDVMMPLMNGIEVCTAIKKNPATCHIPVVLLTAKNLDEHIVDGYEHGADSYIIKPFSSKVLKARIDNLLDNRKMLRGLFKGAGQEEDISAAEISEQDKDFVSRLRTIIKENITDADFGVEAIGQAVGLSRVQLYRKVKAVTGVSVVDLLRKARLQKAKTLLETTGKGIAEIAYEVGFSSPSYFTKCFKDEFEITPGDLKNKR